MAEKSLVEQYLELDKELDQTVGGSPEECALLQELVELGSRMTEEEHYEATAVGARKRDAWRSYSDGVNKITLEEHWRRCRGFDPALPREVPDDPVVLKRAFLGVARMLAEMQREWC